MNENTPEIILPVDQRFASIAEFVGGGREALVVIEQWIEANRTVSLAMVEAQRSFAEHLASLDAAMARHELDAKVVLVTLAALTECHRTLYGCLQSNNGKPTPEVLKSLVEVGAQMAQVTEAFLLGGQR